jgi:rod shape-determining protein MreD
VRTLVQRPIVRLIMVGLVVLTIQTTLFAEVQPFGVILDLVLGFVIAAGIVGGPEMGAFAGFVLGLLFDLVLVTPFGLSALVFGLAGFGIGYVKTSITVEQTWWMTCLFEFVGSAVAVVLYAVGGTLIGQEGWFRWNVLWSALIIGLFNGALAIPMTRTMRWTLRIEREPV